MTTATDRDRGGNRDRGGGPFGGIPDDRLLEKLEETDPDLVAEVRGFDELHDVRDDYDDYIRGEIVDWGPDTPFLESDHTRRDPALSRSMLNLRFNGNRGSYADLPRHPEMFIGFTGNDPRGSVNDPRFDQVRGHMTARAAGLTVRMGDNDDFAIADRPWTGQSISYGMKEILRRNKRNTRVFSVQKEGRPFGRNSTADWYAEGRARAELAGGGGESLGDAENGGADAASARFAAGDYAAADGAEGGAVRGVDAAGDTAPWRHTGVDAELGAERFGAAPAGGRGAAPAAGAGHAAFDQAWGGETAARAAARRTLGADMAAAARFLAAARAGGPDQADGPAYEATAIGAGLAIAADLARVRRHAADDRAPALAFDAAARGAGLAPAADAGRARRGALAGAAENAHLTNVGAIVAGLREGTAAGRRRIANEVVAAGARPAALAEAAPGHGRAPAPAADPRRAAQRAAAPLARAAAAGLDVHVYGFAAPTADDRRVAHARAGDPGVWRASREALPIGRSRPAGEWRSATQADTRLGDEDGAVFGRADEGDGRGGAPVGPKTLRPRAGGDGAWGDNADGAWGGDDGLAGGA